jgi:hypothetical protein
MARPRRNALVLVSDEKIFPAAVFNAVRLAQLNQRSDTDVILWEFRPPNQPILGLTSGRFRHRCQGAAGA